MFEVSSTFIWISIFAISAALVNGIGIFAIFKYHTWAEKIKTYLICFAAGVLISTPLMLALPQAVLKNSNAGFIALGGFLFMFFSNALIRRRTKQAPLAFGITAAEGIGIHSFIDGVIYTVTFSVSVITGILSGIGLVVHEFAEGVIVYLFFMKSNVSKKKAMIYSFLIASLTTPIGAFITYPFMNKLSDNGLGAMLGFVSGVLLYISASHLLPEAREHEKTHSPLAFLLGVLLALFIVFTKA